MGLRISLLLFLGALAGCSREGDAGHAFPPAGKDRVHAAEPEAQESAKALTPGAEESKDLAQCNNRFALTLYEQLRSEQGNLAFAPASIGAVLAMLTAGAAGNTESEMLDVLNLPDSTPELHRSLGALHASWTSRAKDEQLELRFANRIWGSTQFEYRPDFLERLRRCYGAECGRLSFERSDEARETINRWIAGETGERIKELLPPGSITGDTRMVLTSGMYFRAPWQRPFTRERTRNENFRVTADDKVEVPMMHQRGRFPYAAVKGGEVVELPYGKGTLSLVVLLPSAEGGLEECERGLNHESLNAMLAALESEREIDLSLPRFRVTSRLDLREALQALGMKSAFDPDAADLSRMTASDDLWISAVIHQAYIDVNEEGSEAAAATAAIAEPIGPPVEREAVVFRADRPFLYFIRERTTGAVLFVGRLINPNW